MQAAFCVAAMFSFLRADCAQVYLYKMSPRENPDDARRPVKPPSDDVFKNKIQFTSMRSLWPAAAPKDAPPEAAAKVEKYISDDIDRWTVKDGIGNVLWLHYNTVFRGDCRFVADEIARRNLYLFDLWGFVPGSGNGKEPWTQFKAPTDVLGYFEKTLGDRWLGMDNGEQDGRYVRCFSWTFSDAGHDEFSQYRNFQNHFEKLGDCLGNKLSTLVSLNFGHYYLKEGIYTIIGAETAQALPNTQIYYSFIRGAGKQYGVPWFGNVSVFNRWGYKSYRAPVRSDKPREDGPEKGTSLSLMKRLMYTHIMYNCRLAGFENALRRPDGKLSPIGKINREAVKWTEKNPDVGTMQTPVAVMVDFMSGWSFPRYPKAPYMKWGNIPFGKGDYMTDRILNAVYPNFSDASYFRDERGFIAATPYGDVADCVLSDASAEFLRQYPLVIVGGELKPDRELNDTLEAYVRGGGHLVISAAPLANMKNGIAGVRATGKTVFASSPILYGGDKIAETDKIELSELSLPEGAKITKTESGEIAAAEVKFGKGKITVLASPYMISSVQKCSPASAEGGMQEKSLGAPFPLLNYAKAILADAICSEAIFETNPELSLIVCAKSGKIFTVMALNNQYSQKRFFIKPKKGEIVSMREIDVNRDEVSEIGYLPEKMKVDLGKNTDCTIAGGDFRIFEIELKDARITRTPKVAVAPNKTHRALKFGEIADLKAEILHRPTFFRHYDRAVVDWKYLRNRDAEVLAEESGWIKRQGLKVSVDFSSGIDGFAGLRIINNDDDEFNASADKIRSVMRKMKIMGADKMIVTLQRMPENNFDRKNYEAAIVETFRGLADYAEPLGINIVLAPHFCRHQNAPVWGAYSTPLQYNANAAHIAEVVGRKNFLAAVNTALLVSENEPLPQNKKISEILLCGVGCDVVGRQFGRNTSVCKSADSKAIAEAAKSAKDADFTFWAAYDSLDDEYSDSVYLDAFLK